MTGRRPVGARVGAGGMANVWLVARREYVERACAAARSLFSTLLLAGLAVVVALIPRACGSSTGSRSRGSACRPRTRRSRIAPCP